MDSKYYLRVPTFCKGSATLSGTSLEKRLTVISSANLSTSAVEPGGKCLSKDVSCNRNAPQQILNKPGLKKKKKSEGFIKCIGWCVLWIKFTCLYFANTFFLVRDPWSAICYEALTNFLTIEILSYAIRLNVDFHLDEIPAPTCETLHSPFQQLLRIS